MTEALQSRRNELRRSFAKRRPRSGSVPWTWYSGVYFLASGEFIKIGYAHDVRARFRAYVSATPFELAPLGFLRCSSEHDALALEKALHEQFAAYRMGRREWFRDDPSIRTFIKEHAGLWPAPKAKRQDDHPSTKPLVS